MESSKKKQLRKNICVVCGKEFTASGNCKYCSPECRSSQKERNLRTIICKNCGKEAKVYKNAKFCSDECRIYYKNRQQTLRKQDKRNKELQGTENIDYVKCQICGVKARQLGEAHLKSFHNMDMPKYKQLYPKAVITSQKFIQEHLSGSNNPCSAKNSTEQEIRERSPFCKEFYEKRNIDLSERTQLINQISKSREYNTKLSYYLNKGLDEKQAIEKLHERQQTFTLEKCILRYGEEEGRKRFEERQRKWSETMKEKYKNGEYSTLAYSITSNAYSDFEVECINKIIEKMNLSETDYNAVGKTNQFEIFIKGLHKRFRYDFKYNNKIIEFNGDYWHCNPKTYSPEYFNSQLKMTAKEKWQIDKLKEFVAISEGYSILVIWESEYKENPNAVIEKCIQFLAS